MPADSLPVDYLFTVNATTDPVATVPGGPQGGRHIVRVTGGTVEGPRVRGKVQDGGSDWVTLRADGSFKLDVRVTLATDDGAHILMTYNGIGTRTEGGVQLRTAPVFEAGDERYAWLNHVQAVGLGTAGQGTVTYEVYALK